MSTASRRSRIIHRRDTKSCRVSSAMKSRCVISSALEVWMRADSNADGEPMDAVRVQMRTRIEAHCCEFKVIHETDLSVTTVKWLHWFFDDTPIITVGKLPQDRRGHPNATMGARG
jgi:hypothetical protein